MIQTLKEFYQNPNPNPHNPHGAGRASAAPGGELDAPLVTQLWLGAIHTPAALRHAPHPRHAIRHLLHPSVTPLGNRFISSFTDVTSEMSPTFFNTFSFFCFLDLVEEDFTADCAALTEGRSRAFRFFVDFCVTSVASMGLGNASTRGFSGSEIPFRSRHDPHPYFDWRHLAHPKTTPMTSTAVTAQSGARLPRRLEVPEEGSSDVPGVCIVSVGNTEGSSIL